MKGGKALPAAVKQFRGTLKSNTVNPKAPTQETEPPDIPSVISDRAKEWFGIIKERLRAIRCLSRTNTEMMMLLARRLAEIESYDKYIEKEGEFYETVNASGGRMVRANPAIAVRSEAMRHAQSLLAEFGLSLATTSKVTTPSGGSEKGSWANFSQSA